jgi:tetratricopeptide (TPR) repeat protein
MALQGLRSVAAWSAELERSVDQKRLRPRVLAFGGLWFLLTGMLAAAGIWIFFVATVALLLVGSATVAALSLLRRDGAREWVLGIGHSIERASRSLEGRARDLDLRKRVQRSASVASRRARGFAESPERKPPEVDPRRQARRLNTLGAQFRREGAYEQAAEQHRAALAIVRELGDKQAEAMTLNNLALALVHTDGGVPAAIEDFEQALDLLRGLRDDVHEGQVIANIASVRRRQGRDEDADNLLNAALDKLPPESEAYRQVEEQLRRAS